MSFPNYPTLASPVESTRFGESAANPSISKEVEGGYTISRPRSTRKPSRSFKVHYPNMSNADKEALFAFWDQVFGGSNAFYWINPTSGVTHLVRFKNKRLDADYRHYSVLTDSTDDHRWTVGFEIEEV